MEKGAKNNDVIKIAIVGPESTGKSFLAQQLANHYDTSWVPEYAREYCSKITHPCTVEDEMNIFYGQLALETDAEEKINTKSKTEIVKSSLADFPTILFCDTTIVTVKVWCEHVFGFCPQEVQQAYEHKTYQLYLLMNIDLPWEEDPLRDFPELREYFFNKYVELLETKKAYYEVVSGIGEDRFINAKKTVDKFLSSYKVSD